MTGQSKDILVGGKNKSVTLREHALTYRLSGSAGRNSLVWTVLVPPFTSATGRNRAECRPGRLPRGAGSADGEPLTEVQETRQWPVLPS